MLNQSDQTFISSTKCFWSGPAHKKNNSTRHSDTITDIKHNVKKNCVAIMNPERRILKTLYTVL